MAGDMIRRHFLFYGNVQGVGFRYRAHHAAQKMSLTGWVCNLWDGSVEMEIQGEASAIQKALSIINSGHYIMITDTVVRDIPVIPDELGFHVRG